MQPGVPLEKAIIKANIGKIMSTITFDNGERSFGDTALNFDIYSPSNCYVHFLDLLGKKIDNPVVELFKKRFPHYNIVPHPERNTVLFERNDSYVSEYCKLIYYYVCYHRRRFD